MLIKSLGVFTLLLLVKTNLAWAIKESVQLEALEKTLWSKNPQIHSLESRVEAQKSRVRSQFGTFLPQLTLNGGYGDQQTIHETDQGYVGYFTGTWNLFNGGDSFYLKDISEMEFQVAQLDLELARRSLRRQLREIYYALLASKKHLKILDEKAETLKLQRQMAKKKISAGLTSNIDAMEIDLEENNIELERDTIKSENLRLLNQLGSLLDGEVTDMVISGEENFPDFQQQVDIDAALANNPSLKKQSQLEEISHRRLKQTRAEFLPKINLEANYGRLTPQYGNPLNGGESKFFVVLSWNVFSGMSDYFKVKASSAEVLSQKSERKNIYLEIRKELENFKVMNKNLLSLKSRTAQRFLLAQKYYETTLSEYKRGIKNSSDLESATTLFFDSKRKLIELDREISVLNARINELI